MKNPNEIGGGSNVNGKTGWETVEAEAGKLDKFEAQVAKEAAQASRDFEARKEQLGVLRDKIADLAKPSGEYYDGGNLDAKEERYDTSKLETEANGVSREMYETKKQMDRLSTEEGRQAAAEELRQEAEKKEKEARYFEAGMRNESIALEIQSLDERINEASNPDAKAALERVREEWRQRAITFGKGLLEAEEGGGEMAEGTDAEVVKEEGTDIEEGAKSHEPSDTEKVREFAEKIDKGNLMSAARKDAIQVKNLLRKVEKFNVGEAGFFEKRQHKKDLGELARYGYNPNGESSELFKTLSTVDSGSVVGAESLEKVGEQRAKDWKSIDLKLKGESGRQFRKELGKKGFSKIPESWSDDRFTADELRRMAFIAQSSYYDD